MLVPLFNDIHKPMLGLIALIIATSSPKQWKITMQDRCLCCPPTFSLALQWPPRFFHSRIATGRDFSCKKLWRPMSFPRSQLEAYADFQITKILESLVYKIKLNLSNFWANAKGSLLNAPWSLYLVSWCE